MSKLPPNDFPWVSPYLTVVDPDKAADFYQRAFGFTLAESSKDDAGKTIHVEMRYNGAVIMMGAEGTCGNPAKAPVNTENHSPVGLYVYCEDVDAFYQKAIAEGGQSNMEPQDTFWGDRMCSILDDDHHCWSFATPLK